MELFSDVLAIDAISARQAAIAVVGAWLQCQAIAAVYVWGFRGLSYSRSFVMALVVGGIVAAGLMLAIGTSLARGIGIVGTLALIRFRTNLRDPLDMIFVLASFGAGIAAGTGSLGTGIVGTVGFLIIVSAMQMSGFGAQQAYDGIVRVRLPAGREPDAALRAVLQSRCRRFALVTMREVAQGQEIELAWQVSLKDPSAETSLLHDIAAVDGAADVAISMQEATVEL